MLFPCSSANLTIVNLITGKDCFYIYLGHFNGQLEHGKQSHRVILNSLNYKQTQGVLYV